MTKEEVYDTEIFPLMGKIIEICHRAKIAALCNFHLGDNLMCTTATLEEDHEPLKEQLASLNLLQHGFMTFTLTSRIVKSGESEMNNKVKP